MMKIIDIRVLVLLLVVVLSSACMNVRETIEFRKDGTGTYEFEMDMSDMMLAMQDLDGLFQMSGEDTGEDRELVDSLNASLESMNMDTVVNFGELPDSFLNQLEHPELIKNTSMRFVGKSEEGIFKITINTEFQRISDVPGVFKTIRELDSSPAKTDQAVSPEVAYEMLPGGDPESFWQVEKNRLFFPEVENVMGEFGQEMATGFINEEDMKEMSAFLGGNTYRTEIILPKKIKSVSFEGARVENKNFLIIEHSLTQLIQDPSLKEGSVEFKMPRAWKKRLKQRAD